MHRGKEADGASVSPVVRVRLSVRFRRAFRNAPTLMRLISSGTGCG